MFQIFNFQWWKINPPEKAVILPPDLTVRSSKWPAVRAEHLKKHSVCMACGSTTDLAVHHKIPVHLDPSKELDPNNLITLCQKSGRNCHFIVGHACDWTGYSPDVERFAYFMFEHFAQKLNKLPDVTQLELFMLEKIDEKDN